MYITVGDDFQGIHDQKQLLILLKWVPFIPAVVLGYFLIVVKALDRTPRKQMEWYYVV